MNIYKYINVDIFKPKYIFLALKRSTSEEIIVSLRYSTSLITIFIFKHVKEINESDI